MTDPLNRYRLEMFASTTGWEPPADDDVAVVQFLQVSLTSRGSVVGGRILGDHLGAFGLLIHVEPQPAGVSEPRGRMIVAQGQGPAVPTLGVVLPGECRALTHLEVRGLAAEDPVEIGRLPVELVDGMGVAGGDEEGFSAVVLGYGVEVDVVEGFVMGAFVVWVLM